MQEQVRSWALGSQHLKFVTTAIFATCSSSYHAVVEQTPSSGSNSQTLLSWPATTTSGTLEQVAKHQALTGSVHSLHPVRRQPSAADDAQDGESSSAVAVVYSGGGVAFGAQESQKMSPRPAGCRVLSATADDSTLAVVCTVKDSSTPHLLELYNLQVLHLAFCALCMTLCTISASSIHVQRSEGHLKQHYSIMSPEHTNMTDIDIYVTLISDP